ncbi:ATP-dependent DNA ligase [Streptomyces sp. NBC_01471]|uniref:ATP-dependent DNA ligase n=1 Tax=Streptomyces sp. NBC_01471 TaxID=2903879 RepID=UPI00324B021D
MADHPGRYAPMLASEVPAPADLTGWAAEVKWDGMRLVTSVDAGGAVAVHGRSGVDATVRYPELASLAGLVADAPLVLDGEVVALDAAGLPSFSRLQQRMMLAGPARIRTARVRTPVTLMLFDILVHRGTTVTGRPYRERRRLLERLDLPGDGTVAVPPVWTDDPAAGIRWTRDRRLEGVILKRLTSRYQPGRRSPDWIKVKYRPSADIVIAGWLADTHGEPRSLLVGLPGPDGLRYGGAVGSGLSAGQRRLLLPLLTAAAAGTPPFEIPAPGPPAGVHWVLPLLEGEVHYAELTRDGILRQPSWKGLRGIAGE